jgi:hypothetical protein
MSHSEEEIRKTLSYAPLDSYFIVGESIMYIEVLPSEVTETPVALLIEDDDLARACREFLTARGAKRFSTWQEFKASRQPGDDD